MAADSDPIMHKEGIIQFVEKSYIQNSANLVIWIVHYKLGILFD